MSPIRVIDSYGLIAFFGKEKGAERVLDFIQQASDTGVPLLLTLVNWGEVYYSLCRSGGREAAEKAMVDLEALPIEMVVMDRALTLEAARLKSMYKMSYADCFAAALAKERKAEVITGDKEFKEVEHLIKIQWI